MVKRRKSKKLLRFSRPLTRATSRNGTTQNDTFGYNPRSELTSATLGNANYAYAFDNIGNRETSSEAGTALAYTANNLNQYTEICSAEPIQQTATPSAQLSALQLSYDADGNATLIQTSTGTWAISYNGANRPVRFRNEETDTTVECGYDSQGRRYFKKVTVAGTVTLHHRYIYRGYLQIVCVDCTRSGHPALWFVTWDPSQATATRPLAIQKDGTWFTYGYDITKNVCEVFGPAGYIRTAYSYAPFGNVSASGDVSQPFQWSSEHYDSELDLVYYNFRHYSPALGRFLSRDPIAEQGGLNLYAFVRNNPNAFFDEVGTRGKSGRPKPKPLYPGRVGRPITPEQQEPPFWGSLIEAVEDIFSGEFSQKRKELEAAIIMSEISRNGKELCLKNAQPDDCSLCRGGCCVITVYAIKDIPARISLWGNKYIPGREKIVEIVSVLSKFYSTPCENTHFIFDHTPPVEPILHRFSIDPEK